jgi:Na+/serine symporter
MTIDQIYTRIRSTILIFCGAVGAAIFYAFLVFALCRYMFGLSEDIAMKWIGIPLFFVFAVIGFRYVPRILRNAGHI